MYYSTASEGATMYRVHDPEPWSGESERDTLDRAYQKAVDTARDLSVGSSRDWLVRLHDGVFQQLEQARVVCRYRDGNLIPV
jgi:hypothetical protein